MFENGCYLRRQKRFKDPKKEHLRLSQRGSSSDTPDGREDGLDDSMEEKHSPGKLAASVSAAEAPGFHSPPPQGAQVST